MIRYRYISRHPVLLNYTPILHDSLQDDIDPDVDNQVIKRHSFWPQIKHRCFTISLFYFPQKCAMRSSSIESNNTTIYNRPILCNSQEQLGESFFPPFVKWLCQYWEYSNWQLRTRRCTLPVWGRKKNTKILEKKQQHGGVWDRKSKSYKPQWDYRRQNKLLNTVQVSFIFRQNK